MRWALVGGPASVRKTFPQDRGFAIDVFFSMKKVRQVVKIEPLPNGLSKTHGRRKGAACFQPPISARAAHTFPAWHGEEISAARFGQRQQDAAAPLRALHFRKSFLQVL
jgi:hypothetical protein